MACHCPAVTDAGSGAERQKTDGQTYRTPAGTYGIQTVGSEKVHAHKGLSRPQLSILAHMGVASQLPQDRPAATECFRAPDTATVARSRNEEHRGGLQEACGYPAQYRPYRNGQLCRCRLSYRPVMATLLQARIPPLAAIQWPICSGRNGTHGQGLPHPHWRIGLVSRRNPDTCRTPRGRKDYKP